MVFNETFKSFTPDKSSNNVESQSFSSNVITANKINEIDNSLNKNQSIERVDSELKSVRSVNLSDEELLSCDRINVTTMSPDCFDSKESQEGNKVSSNLSREDSKSNDEDRNNDLITQN